MVFGCKQYWRLFSSFPFQIKSSKDKLIGPTNKSRKIEFQLKEIIKSIWEQISMLESEPPSFGRMMANGDDVHFRRK